METTTPHSGLRRARGKDAVAIHALILAATARGKILKRSLTDIRRALRHFWVIEHDGVIIACCALEIYNRKLAEVRSLAVDPAQEKQGLASKLIEACILEAKKHKVYEVLAITNRENIFRRHGFSEQLHDQKALFLRP